MPEAKRLRPTAPKVRTFRIVGTFDPPKTETDPTAAHVLSAEGADAVSAATGTAICPRPLPATLRLPGRERPPPTTRGFVPIIPTAISVAALRPAPIRRPPAAILPPPTTRGFVPTVPASISTAALRPAPIRRPPAAILPPPEARGFVPTVPAAISAAALRPAPIRLLPAAILPPPATRGFVPTVPAAISAAALRPAPIHLLPAAILPPPEARGFVPTVRVHRVRAAAAMRPEFPESPAERPGRKTDPARSARRRSAPDGVRPTSVRAEAAASARREALPASRSLLRASRHLRSRRAAVRRAESLPPKGRAGFRRAVPPSDVRPVRLRPKDRAAAFRCRVGRSIPPVPGAALLRPVRWAACRAAVRGGVMFRPVPAAAVSRAAARAAAVFRAAARAAAVSRAAVRAAAVFRAAVRAEEDRAAATEEGPEAGLTDYSFRRFRTAGFYTTQKFIRTFL